MFHLKQIGCKSLDMKSLENLTKCFRNKSPIPSAPSMLINIYFSRSCTLLCTKTNDSVNIDVIKKKNRELGNFVVFLKPEGGSFFSGWHLHDSIALMFRMEANILKWESRLPQKYLQPGFYCKNLYNSSSRHDNWSF